MITVTFDTRMVAKQLGYFSDRAADVVLNRIQKYVRDRVQVLLKARTSQINEKRYGDALSITKHDHRYVLVRLKDKKMQALETGNPGWDMKPGILAHAKHMTKEGVRYVNVPFVHRTSKRGSGTGYVQIKGMRQAINAAVQSVKATGGKRKLFTPDANHPYMRKHSNMQVAKEQKSDKIGARTWRILSDKTPKDKWMYPKKTGLFVLKALGEEIEQNRAQLMASFLKGL
jgi:hypothetical protein